jgi:hypothetical protein
MEVFSESRKNWRREQVARGGANSMIASDCKGAEGLELQYAPWKRTQNLNDDPDFLRFWLPELHFLLQDGSLGVQSDQNTPF